MSSHAHRRPSACGGARRRSSSSSSLSGLPLDGFVSVLRQVLVMNGDQQDGGWSSGCVREKMKSETHRLMSFERWPSSAPVFRSELAKSGFFYVGPDDKVQCFSCGGNLKCRSFRSNGMHEHRKYFPFCRFIMGQAVGNIPRPQPMGQSPGHWGGLESLGTEASHLNNPARPDMVHEWRRESSFCGWPKDQVKTCQLAKAGFYYTGYDDLVRCFYCSAGVSNWKRHHDPWMKHAKYFPRCEFLKQQKGPDYIRAVQEQYCESPEPANARRQNKEQSTRQQQGLDSLPAQPPSRATPAQSLFAPESLFACLTSPLVQSVISGDFEQATRQFFQGTIMQHEKPCESFMPFLDFTNIPAKGDTACANVPREEKPASPNHSAGRVPTPSKPAVLTTSETIQEQLRQLQEERVCKICMDNEVSIVFVPCGHLVVCTECAPELFQCPNLQSQHPRHCPHFHDLDQ